MSSPKRELSTRTYQEKYQIIKYVQEHPGMKKKDIASHFNLKPSTLTTILKKKDIIVKIVEENSDVTGKLKRLKTVPFGVVGKSLRTAVVMTSPKRKLHTRTYKEKYKIIKYFEEHPGVMKKDVASRFNLKQNTLSTILQKKDVIVKTVEEKSEMMSKLKRLKVISYENVDKALLAWCRQVSPNIYIANGVLLIKANEFAKEFGHQDKVSMGWVERFKTRYGIGKIGRIGKADDEADEWVTEWNGQLKEILHKFEPQDIYNADETGLFWQMLPEQSLGFIEQKYPALKQPKTRITFLVCANMDGSDKVPLLVIGKRRNPNVFQGVEVSVEYKANKKAWMTAELFESWLQKFDRRMISEVRKIALIIDSCAAHPKSIKLKNITLFFLPPSTCTTSIIQPMNGGVIKNLKHHFRKSLSSKRLDAIDKNEKFKWDILDALVALKSAWERVTPETIRNGYRSVGFKFKNSKVPDVGVQIKMKDGILEENVEAVEDHDRQEEEEMKNIWERLGELVQLPRLNDYREVDDNVDVVERLTNQEIVDSITTMNEDYDDEEDDDTDDEDDDYAANDEDGDYAANDDDVVEADDKVEDDDDNGEMMCTTDKPITIHEVFQATDLIRKFNLSIDCPDDIRNMFDRYEEFLLGLVASRHLEKKLFPVTIKKEQDTNKS